MRDDPEWLRFKRWLKRYDLAHTSGYELLKSGKIRSAKHGNQRHVNVPDTDAYFAANCE